MSIIYCQLCTAWSLFNDLKCQVCHQEQNYDCVYPTAEELLQSWGMPTDVIGKIALIRHQLPRIGYLIACENGLAFIPELEESTSHYLDHFPDGVTKNSLLKKLWNANQPEFKQDELANLVRLHPSDIWQKPGSFFISWTILEKIMFHQKIWSMQLENQRAYTFQVLTLLPVFNENLSLIARKHGLSIIIDQR